MKLNRRERFYIAVNVLTLLGVVMAVLHVYRVQAQSPPVKPKLLGVVQASRIELVNPKGQIALRMECVKKDITGNSLPRVQLFDDGGKLMGEIGIRLGSDGKEHAYFYMLSEDTKVSLLTLPPVWRVP